MTAAASLLRADLPGLLRMLSDFEEPEAEAIQLEAEQLLAVMSSGKHGHLPLYLAAALCLEVDRLTAEAGT